MSRPTIVFALGAWCLPTVFEDLQSLLSLKGISSECPAHPSIGAEPPTKTLTDDVVNLRECLERLVGQGKDIIVVAHSYGGVVTSNAVEGLLKTDRQSLGLKGGIVMVVYMSAFVLPKGSSLKDMLGGEFLPWMKVEDSYVHCSSAPQVGFHDLSLEEQQKWVSTLTHTSLAVFSGPSTYEPWTAVPSAYILCSEDQALPYPIQQQMAQALGTKWTYELKASHFPFLSMPEMVVDILVELVGEVTSERAVAKL